MNSLMVLGLLVRAEKQAEELEKSASLTGMIRGAGRVVQTGATATGKQVSKELGGGLGARTIGSAITAAPTVGAVGLGAYGVDALSGHPIQRFVANKRQQIAQRLASRSSGANAVYDPQTGQWY